MTVALHGDRRDSAVRPQWVAYPQVFSGTECAELIGMMSRSPGKDAGLVDGQAEGSVRSTQILWLPETEETSWVHRRLAEVVAQANREAFDFALSGFDEQVQLARYSDGAFYDWHIDRGGRGAGRGRKLSVSVQLSHPLAYTGGQLELNPDGHVVQAPQARGTVIVFPSFVLHRVTPVTQGVRHSLVVWTHGPDFR